ncbi:MAG TPA: PIN domain-containing protein [Gaiellaceae bacterium]|nr:PIN domain-containing protein [Gaiellaceae bacterium]
MVVAVFDTDVLIAYRDRRDAQHAEAIERMRRALLPGVTRRICAVSLGELLVGPLRAQGPAGADQTVALLGSLRFDVVAVDAGLARGAGEVRAQTNLKLPDAYVLATALAARSRTDEVRVETFDAALDRASAALLAEH